MLAKYILLQIIIQLTLEQYRFELCTCTLNSEGFFQKICAVLYVYFLFLRIVPHDFLGNIFSFLAYLIVRIQHIIHLMYKICGKSGVYVIGKAFDPQ